MANSLYICYFGLREPLVQTQVLPYIRELLKGAVAEATLLTFEPGLRERWSNEQLAEMKAQLAAEGIAWHVLPYHKRFSALATGWDILRGTLRVHRLISDRKVDILHGRVHVPTLMGAMARKLSSRSPKLLFDIRGFFPEEYTDSGVWPKGGVLFRSAKRVERWLMNEADGFVVLTEKAREVLFPEASTESDGTALGFRDGRTRPVEVIPCCVDFEARFPSKAPVTRESIRKKLGAEGRFVVTHVGALGGLYLTDELADFMAAAKLKDPTTFAMFLTQTNPQQIVPLLEARGFKAGDYFVARVAPNEIQQYVSAADLALSFVKASYSTMSRSPTKIPEYLACGLPIVANQGVGDVDRLIEDSGVGAIVEQFSPAGYARALEKIEDLGEVGDRCRAVARERFDLQVVGGTRYRRLYGRLLAS